MEENKRKKCFVITPIGEEGSAIRRHIDGIINAAIKPALEEQYDVKAAHEITATGSINNQVIVEIYTSDLVVANLTSLNPNVMYELAFRHALKKPVIMIIEKDGKRLPFDVINERTIFYVNDSQGVLDLKDEIRKVEKAIDFNNVSNPIYDALNNYVSDESLIKNIQSRNIDDANVLKIILNKIVMLESSIKSIHSETEGEDVLEVFQAYLELILNEEITNDKKKDILLSISNMLYNNSITSKYIVNISYNIEGFKLNLDLKLKDYTFISSVENIFKDKIKEFLQKIGENIVFKFEIFPF